MYKLFKSVKSWLILAPFILLGLVFVINPLIQEAAYCPLPTFFEQSHGFLPAVMTYWYVYAIAIIVLEIVLGYVWLFVAGLGQLIFSRYCRDLEACKEKGRRYLFLSLPMVSVIISVTLWMGIQMLIQVLEARSLAGIYARITDILAGVLILGTTVWVFVVGILQFRRDDEKHRYWKGSLLSSLLVLIPVLLLPAIFLTTTQDVARDRALSAPGGSSNAPSVSYEETSEAADTIGLSVGGAKDIDNFRENIEQCYLPTPTDLTTEGIYYDYHFDTQNQTECTNMFCPQYEAAVLPDPFNKQDEHFLRVGLGSGITQEEFQRPPLNLIVVLDVSGSMSSPFDRYHYDQYRSPNQESEDDIDRDKEKLQVAREAIGGLTDHLKDNDRFGMVTYESRASQFLSVEALSERGASAIKTRLEGLRAGGGTDMEAGLRAGTRLMRQIQEEKRRGYENRLVFLTDAMPNTGELDDSVLYQKAKENAQDRIHTTFIGIGVDFNTELIEGITNDLRGANYFSVHQGSEFKERLANEFRYWIAPLAYDVSLRVQGGDYRIKKVYGSPEAESSTGDMLKIKTLFPSPTEEGASKGGVVLAQMEKVSNTGSSTRVVASYEPRGGQAREQEQSVSWANTEDPSGTLRKAVLLARYTNLMNNWLIDENHRLGPPQKTIYVPIDHAPRTFRKDGLPMPEERYQGSYERQYITRQLSEWERLSRRLVVSEDYKDTFRQFLKYFDAEAKAIDDDTLSNERELLKNLLGAPTPGMFAKASKE